MMIIDIAWGITIKCQLLSSRITWDAGRRYDLAVIIRLEGLNMYVCSIRLCSLCFLYVSVS